MAAATVLTTVLGPVTGPARADSIDEKRRQAAAIADQLDALAERMNGLGEDYPRPSPSRAS